MHDCRGRGGGYRAGGRAGAGGAVPDGVDRLVPQKPFGREHPVRLGDACLPIQHNGWTHRPVVRVGHAAAAAETGRANNSLPP